VFFFVRLTSELLGALLSGLGTGHGHQLVALFIDDQLTPAAVAKESLAAPDVVVVLVLDRRPTVRTRPRHMSFDCMCSASDRWKPPARLRAKGVGRLLFAIWALGLGRSG
jgi:hypothetical protein